MARERNSKGVTVYRKAYNSLSKCPIEFQHPSEAKQLEGFGDKLCQRLTDKMNEYCAERGQPLPTRRQKGTRNSGQDNDGEGAGDAGTAPKKTRKPKPYVPTLGSGAYAIVMALASLGEDSPGVHKDEVIRLAQPYTESSFTAASHANKFYTAWNSMKTLEDKDIVHARGKPKRYFLLDEGWEVARRMQKAQGITSELHDHSSTNAVEALAPPGTTGEITLESTTDATLAIPNGEIITSETTLPTFEPIILPPGSFSVELVIDTREVRAKQDRDYVQNNLAERGVVPTTRSLPLGDILWVARLRDSALKAQHGEEVLLDYIVERKRMDDLIGSIKDGRFHDQKFRLQRSGVRNVIYIIEEFAMDSDHYAKYDDAVQSAIASMQVLSGYFVKKTQMMDDTIRYLVSMTNFLRKRYEDKPLKLIPTNVITAQNYLPLLEQLRTTDPTSDYHITYPTFAALSSKSQSLTLRDVYLKMLMCTRGVTGEKALEIQNRWRTPIELYEAYKNCENGRTVDEARKRKCDMISGEMGGLVGRKKIQKALSGKISEVWATG